MARTDGILDRFEPAGLVIDVARVAVHEGDEPDALPEAGTPAPPTPAAVATIRRCRFGRKKAATLLAAIGFKPVDDLALFPDKYFVIYRR